MQDEAFEDENDMNVQHARNVKARCMKKRRLALEEEEGKGAPPRGPGGRAEGGGGDTTLMDVTPTPGSGAMERMKKAPDAATIARRECGQIFTSGESCEIILREMCSGVIESSNRCMWFADSVDDDVGQWLIKLYFTGGEVGPGGTESPLAEQLRQVGSAHGYGFVELRMVFQTDLYPFYPPSIRLVRPRLKGHVMERLASLPCLKLAHWNPMTRISELLEDVKSFLLDLGEVDLGHPRNCMRASPSGAYTGMEYALSALSITSDTTPLRARADEAWEWRGPKQCSPLSPVGGGAGGGKGVTAEPSLPKDGGKGAWAKGTGYGHGDSRSQGPIWDVAQHEAALKRKMEKTEAVLSELLRSLTGLQGLPEDLHAFCRGDETPPLLPDLGAEEFALLRDSSFAPFAAELIMASPLQEMLKRLKTYATLLALLRVMSSSESLSAILGPLPGMLATAPSIEVALRPIADQAVCFLENFRKMGKAECGAGSKGTEEERLSQAVVDTARAVTKAVNSVSAYEEAVADTACNGRAEPGTPDAAGCDPEEAYMNEMRPMQFDSCSLTSTSKRKHMYLNQVEKEHNNGSMARDRMTRLASDLAALQNSLPLSRSSTVCVRADDSRPDLMRVLITGPDDTPYEGGCFVFDMGFPPSYPNIPPKMGLRTTGEGNARFNPNLYQNGKVCLSLLGTWGGAQGEQWDRDSSTLLQVLVSVQSLIFVPDPYFNEPGFEKNMHSRESQHKSYQYNQNIRVECARWAMLNALQHPTPGLEETIRMHFRLKKEHILKQCKAWLQEMTSPPKELGDTSGQLKQSVAQNAAAMRDILKKLRAEFATL